MESNRQDVDLIDAVGELFKEYTDSQRTPFKPKNEKFSRDLDDEARFTTSTTTNDEEGLGGNHHGRKRMVWSSHERLNFTSPRHGGIGSGVPRLDARAVELAKIYELWQHAKRELQTKSREIAYLKGMSGRLEVEARLSRINAAENEELLRERQALTEQVHTLKGQIEAARTENDRWSQSYNALANELKLVRESQENTRHEVSTISSHQRSLEEELQSLRVEKERLLSESIQDRQKYDEDIALAQEKVKDMQQRVSALNRELEDARLGADQTDRIATEYRSLIENKERELAEIRGQLDVQREELFNDARISAKHQLYETQARIDHLRVDNTRLLNLLHSTDEYKEFCEYMLDAGETKGLTYFPSASAILPEGHLVFSPTNRSSNKKMLSASSSCHEHCKIPHRSSHQRHQWADKTQEIMSLEHEYGSRSKDSNWLKGDEKPTKHSSMFEHEKWVPIEAVNIGTGFRNKYLPHVSLDLIGGLLKDLNSVWQKRETRILKKVKDQYERQLYEMKRKVGQSSSYEEVMQKHKIMRLEQRLKTTSASLGRRSKTKNKDKAGSSNAIDKGSQLSIAAALAELEDMSYRYRDLQTENVKLKLELDKHDGSRGDIRLENLHRECMECLGKISTRMRDCSKKVSNMDRFKEENYVHLMSRAYFGMMEDIEQQIDALNDVLNHYLPKAPSQRLFEQSNHKPQVLYQSKLNIMDLHHQ